MQANLSTALLQPPAFFPTPDLWGFAMGEPMSDISLAVVDGARRMTYAELAAVRGISKHAAETLVRRRKWLKQIGNDGVVRVLVPPDEAPRRQRVTTNTDCDPPLSAPLIREVVGEAVGAYIGPLTAQLERETIRAERAERQLEVERQRVEDSRKRIDELHTALADAVTAERIAAGEAAALRTIVTGLQERPWWRRWFR